MWAAQPPPVLVRWGPSEALITETDCSRLPGFSMDKDLKEVREEVTQITETGVFQTVGTVSIKPLSSSVLGGASQKDKRAGVRKGGTVGPCDHLLTETHTEHLL